MVSCHSHSVIFIMCAEEVLCVRFTHIEDIFAEVGPVVSSVLDGINVSVFAYGQTGAGKTFTFVNPKP
jgi:Cdc6-like AAA superfamily ATPase